MNLGGPGPGFAVAACLRQLGIPFVFLTGYDLQTIPSDLRDAPHVEKPADFRHLVKVSSGFLGRG